MFNDWVQVLFKSPLFKSYIRALEDHPPEIAANFEELTNRVLADPHLVYPCRMTQVQYQMESNNRLHCSVTFVDSWEERFPTSLGFRPDFRGLQHFSRGMLILGSQIFEDIKKQYIQKPRCDLPEKDTSLSANQLQGIFWLLLVGAISALFVFTTETCISLALQRHRMYSRNVASGPTRQNYEMAPSGSTIKKDS